MNPPDPLGPTRQYKITPSLSLSFSPVQNIESGIASHAPSVASLNAAGEKLLSSSSAENTAEIQRDLADLNKK
jgi:hypothetical protein